MFLMLSRVLLWLLIGTIAYTLFQKWFPNSNFFGKMILIALIVVLALSFVNPNEPALASIWQVVTFPLKPLGAAILLMILAAQKLKEGAIGKPGGNYLVASLLILLFASTPAFGYFLFRLPLATGTNPVVSEVQVVQLPSNSLATAPGINGSTIVADMNLRTPYLAQAPQTPQDITRPRPLQLSDFVPSAQMLSITTREWERYLAQIYFFLGGGRS
ncbi:hypothetical protein [Calothrix sp. NIES-3974]|uniref:hypothetical protein n=1 Tax=Calothrix sp. NIES-3974 TaxID=2005462 RepID=UPI000B5E66A0|nr:hypothetical protein [Calothrix sp. NIES-3974]BAZ06711.1 hypothetical protein NIES3974_33730 [Calothrix sp. NIES-3974]